MYFFFHSFKKKKIIVKKTEIQLQEVLNGPEKDNYSDISDGLVKYFNNPAGIVISSPSQRLSQLSLPNSFFSGSLKHS